MFFFNELKPLIAKISLNSEDLTTIQLSHKKITDKNLLQISDALQTNTNVTEIWLTNNLITDVGSLTAVLERNDTAVEVYLGGNKIGDKGGKFICLSDFCGAQGSFQHI
jgi:Ran GTPase-activating protein (RanGAP) involved in mRNA processing and transport